MLFSFHQRNTRFIRFTPLFSLFSFKHHFSSPQKSTKTHIDTSSIPTSGATKSIFDKCYDLLVKKTGPSSTPQASSLQEILLSVAHVSPGITRKFWRKSGLEPRDVLDLLLGFESETGKSEIDVKKVGSLWGVFKWADEQVRVFRHLDRSFRVMVAMLVRVGWFGEAESLVLAMEEEGVSLDDHEVFSKLIEWYIGANKLHKGLSMYDRMKLRKLVPSSSCHRVLIDSLFDAGEPRSAVRVCCDMLESGLAMGAPEKAAYENVVRLLCRSGLVQEARNVIKKASVRGIEPTRVALDAIAIAYCSKRDYDDLLSLFVETDCRPEIAIVNMIVHSVCGSFGAESGRVLMEELERLGCSPDDVTISILIGWSCRERNLRNAFVHLSNGLSRGLKPNVYAYNALIGGLFNGGLWSHATEVLREMEDNGPPPELSTFRVMLAGYCKARRFDEVTAVIGNMVNDGLITILPSQDPLSRAFVLLGIDLLAVRVKRDNDRQLSKAEFFDGVGNGLYLEGDIDEAMTIILDDSMVPDFNRLILNDNGIDRYKTAYAIIRESIRWGQELSFEPFSTLLKRFHASNSGFNAIIGLSETMPELDGETLNLLVQAHVKRGFMRKAKTLYDQLVERNLPTENETCSGLVTGLCKKGMLTEALVVFDRLLRAQVGPHAALECFYPVVDGLCGNGLARVARVLFDELQATGRGPDQVAFNRLLHGLCSEKRYSEAFVVLDRMLNKRMAPDLVVHCELNFRAGKIEDAMRLIRETSSTGKPLDADVYNVLVHGYCAVNDSRRVREVVGAVLRRDVGLSVLSYRRLVSATCAEGRARFALWMKDLVKGPGPDLRVAACNVLIFHLFSSGHGGLVDTVLDGLDFDETTYNFLVHGLCSGNDASRAYRYLTEMISKGLNPSRRCLKGVVRWLCSTGDVREALRLSHEMESRALVHCSTVQNDIVVALLESDRLDEAVDFLDRMVRHDLVPDHVSYDSLIRRMCRHGRRDKAVELLDVMLRKGTVPSPTSYDYVIRDLCGSNRVQEGLDFLAEMSGRGLAAAVETREAVVGRLCESGAAAEAERVLRSTEVPSRAMFVSVVGGYRSEGNFSAAAEVLQMMQECGHRPDFATHWSLVSTLSRSGDGDDGGSRGFLSRLLSESGFTKNGVKPNRGN